MSTLALALTLQACTPLGDGVAALFEKTLADPPRPSEARTAYDHRAAEFLALEPPVMMPTKEARELYLRWIALNDALLAETRAAAAPELALSMLLQAEQLLVHFGRLISVPRPNWSKDQWQLYRDELGCGLGEIEILELALRYAITNELYTSDRLKLADRLHASDPLRHPKVPRELLRKISVDVAPSPASLQLIRGLDPL